MDKAALKSAENREIKKPGLWTLWIALQCDRRYARTHQWNVDRVLLRTRALRAMLNVQTSYPLSDGFITFIFQSAPRFLLPSLLRFDARIVFIGTFSNCWPTFSLPLSYIHAIHTSDTYYYTHWIYKLNTHALRHVYTRDTVRAVNPISANFSYDKIAERKFPFARVTLKWMWETS